MATTTEKELKTIILQKDTWILEMPLETCRAEGFAEGTMVSLTFKNGIVTTSVISPSAEVDDFISQIVEEEKEYFEEMRKIGD